MQKEILEYLKTQRIGVLAVEMLDGSPHGATVHFAHAVDPFSIIILTSASYRKSESILKNGTVCASFVVGVDESNMKTFQLDGTVSLTGDNETKEVYFGKFPEKKIKYDSSKDIFLIFKPNWWRFTDFRSPQGKLILTNE